MCWHQLWDLSLVYDCSTVGKKTTTRFTVEELCPGNCSDTCKTSPRKSLWGDVGVNHSQHAWRTFLCISRSQPGRDGPCLCSLSLPWGKPRSRAALPSVLQRYQLLSKFCIDSPGAGVQVTTAGRGPRLCLSYGRCHYGIGRDQEPLDLPMHFGITSSEGILQAAGI